MGAARQRVKEAGQRIQCQVAVTGDRTYSTIEAGFNDVCALDTAGESLVLGLGQLGKRLSNGNVNEDKQLRDPVEVAGDRTYHQP